MSTFNVVASLPIATMILAMLNVNLALFHAHVLVTDVFLIVKKLSEIRAAEKYVSSLHV